MNVSLPIPFVGNFKTKGNIAAISFNENLHQDTLGRTTKQHFEGKLFATNNNKLNLQILNNSQMDTLKNSIGGMLRNTTAQNANRSFIKIAPQHGNV